MPAVKFARVANSGLMLANALPATFPATLMGWVRPTTLPAAAAYDNYLSFSHLQPSSVGTGISIFNTGGAKWDLGTTATDNTGSAVVAGVWCHVALVIADNSSKKLYVNGVLDVTASVAGALDTQMGIGVFGDPGTSVVAPDGRICHVRLWSAELSQAEIIVERDSLYYVKELGIRFASVLNSAKELYDYGPYNRTLTIASTSPTTEDGMPMALKPEYRRRFFGRDITLDAGGTVTTVGIGTAGRTRVHAA